MAVQDQKLQSFFLKQKKASIDALLSKDVKEPTSISIDQEKLTTDKAQKTLGEEGLRNTTLAFKKEHLKDVSKPLVSLVQNKQHLESEFSNLSQEFELSNSHKKESVSNALAMREQDARKTINDSPDIEPGSKESDNYLVSKEVLEERLDRTINRAPDMHALDEIIGKERALLFYVFKKCQSKGSMETGSITTEELSEILGISAVRVRNLIFRLSKKSLLEVSKYKNGHAGWRRFKLSEENFSKLSFNENLSNSFLDKPMTSAVPVSKISPEKKSNASDSVQVTPLGQEWEDIDFQCLKSIGFTKAHIAQLAQTNKLTPSMVQDSINAFSFDLEHNKKAQKITSGNPLGFFMGIIRKGTVYAAPSNYESANDRTMRLYLEKKRADEEKRASIEKELSDLDFNEWSAGLTASEKEKYMPAEIAQQKMTAPKVSHLRSYHKENIWPKKRAALLAEHGVKINN